MEGYILVHRKIMNHYLFKENREFSRFEAWVDMLLLAQHGDTKFTKKGHVIELKRGQLGRSEVELCDRWSWSRSKVRTFLKQLENEQQIVQQKNNLTSLITITNYDAYQKNEQQNEHRKNSRRTPKEQQKNTERTHTINVNECEPMPTNDEPNNTEGKPSPRAKFSAPTLEMVLDYCKERNNRVNAQQFIDYYESKGWLVGKSKMKDWKASVRTWENNGFDNNRKQSPQKMSNDNLNYYQENLGF